MKKNTLDEIPCGYRAKIENINDSEPDKQRLTDMGLTKGSIIIPLFTSPSADPRAYNVKGAVIAIRKKQAKNIKVLSSGCDNHEQ